MAGYSGSSPVVSPEARFARVSLLDTSPASPSSPLVGRPRVSSSSSDAHSLHESPSTLHASKFLTLDALPSPNPPGPRTLSFFSTSSPVPSPPRSRANSTAMQPSPSRAEDARPAPLDVQRPRTVSASIADFESTLQCLSPATAHGGTADGYYAAVSRYPTVHRHPAAESPSRAPQHPHPESKLVSSDKGKGRAKESEVTKAAQPPLLHGTEMSDGTGRIRIVNVIGSGAFASVCLADWWTGSATPKVTPTRVAAKIIVRRRCDENERVRTSVNREVEVLRKMKHPALIHLLSSIETPEHEVLILEYAGGGDLFDFVETYHARVSEALCRRIFGELADVCAWMHSHNLVHRDIKLENVLLTADATALLDTEFQVGPSERVVRLTDFGLSRFIDPARPHLETRCGSECYAASELIMGKSYDGRQTDAWALGVVLFALVVGHLPFVATSAPGGRRNFLMRIAKSDYSWPVDARLAGPDAQALTGRLLDRDPMKRLPVHEIFSASSWPVRPAAPNPDDIVVYP